VRQGAWRWTRGWARNGSSRFGAAAPVWHGVRPTPCSTTTSCCCPADALSYLTTRLQSEFKVEVGVPQPQRRAISALVKPLGQPPQAGKQQ
jgi:hypothetical protein